MVHDYEVLVSKDFGPFEFYMSIMMLDKNTKEWLDRLNKSGSGRYRYKMRVIRQEF